MDTVEATVTQTTNRGTTVNLKNKSKLSRITSYHALVLPITTQQLLSNPLLLTQNFQTARANQQLADTSHTV